MAEEAAKLIAVLQGWASSAQGGESPGGTSAEDGSAGGDWTHGSPECRYCPACQLMRVAKAATPEVREHLGNAMLSLALAIKGLLENVEEPSGRKAPVEKIDLTED